MTTLMDAPMFAGGRPRARQILDKLADTPLKGKTVKLDCASLVVASASFSDEVVRSILVDRDAGRLVVTNVSDPEFARYMRKRADFYGVAHKLHLDS